VSRSGVFIERAGLKLLDPDPDQVARNVVAFRSTVSRLARNEFLDDLPFEFDAMGTVLGHVTYQLRRMFMISGNYSL
jgi:hypothetical protein